MTRGLTMLALVIASAGAAGAQDDYSQGRVLSVEPGVTVQRATEGEAEEATPNLPFLPGDRVWTDHAGRAEFQFGDGSVVRLGSGSKLDYADGGGDRVILRLWSGAMYLHARDGRGHPDFAVEAPSAVVEVHARGVYRIDAGAGETRLSVYEGEATLAGEREVRVGAGEQVAARQGEEIADPQAFDRASLDDFDRWAADHEDRPVYAAGQRAYLPEVVSAYAGELDSYGAWYYESEIGHVWRPYVASGWRPYFDGRWAWTPFGWTWVAAEPWGWAPFHFGRWGYTPMLGWYWIPDSVWGPGWVSWAYAGDYVGWCPLGYRDKPILFGGRRTDRAVARGTQAAADQPWVYVRRADFSARDLARMVQQTIPAGEEMHALLQPHARPDRNLHAALGSAEPHTGSQGAKARPGHGDGASEPRADTATSLPTARRRHEPEDEAAVPARPAGPATAPGARPLHPLRTAPAPDGTPEHGRPADAHPQSPHPQEADHEVLRRVFGPLSQPRPAEPVERGISHPLPSAESERSSRTRPGRSDTERPAPSRGEPRDTSRAHGQSPPPAQPPADSGAAQGSARPAKDRDH